MRIALMAALAANRTIGRNNALPWHLPNDLKYFKAVTLGKPVIMGRKTWESLGRPLPGRTNIVVTRQAGYLAENTAANVKVVASMDAAFALASGIAQKDGVEECVVIGGAEIYAQMLPRCDRMYLTEVHADIEGDAFFPLIDPAQWRETHRERFAADSSNPYAYSFVTYDRL